MQKGHCGAAPNGDAPFDFTGHMRRLCADMAQRLSELGHVDMGRVAIRFCQVRKSAAHGLQATLTPMRFADGALHDMRRSGRWAVQPLHDEAGREMLYLLSFYLPRFLNHPLAEKLSIVIHELWHIGPAFDGDLRRHPGRCYAHSHSQKAYDAAMGRLVDKWLGLGVPAAVYDFLQFDFGQLQRRHGAVVGHRIPTPKLVRVRGSAGAGHNSPA